MPTDNLTLIALCLGGLLIVWLVFSLIRKVFGLLLLAALAVGCYVLWTNPAMQASLLDAIGSVTGWR